MDQPAAPSRSAEVICRAVVHGCLGKKAWDFDISPCTRSGTCMGTATRLYNVHSHGNVEREGFYSQS
jgi:hypothetical protein